MDGYSLDRIKGIFVGHFLGDALGAPHESWKWNRNTAYTGKLEIRPYSISRGNTKDNPDNWRPVGSVTDDTQMTIALMRPIISDGNYDKDSVTMEYVNWVHIKPKGLGKNTRYVFGLTGLQGHEKRIEELEKLETPALSNGALMRCAPLALFDDWEELAEMDAYQTNPYPQIVICNRVYLRILRECLSGGTGDDILKVISNIMDVFINNLDFKHTKDAIQDAFKSILNLNDLDDEFIAKQNVLQAKAVDRDISGKAGDKGFYAHALYCAIRSLLMVAVLKYTYEEAMHWVITQQDLLFDEVSTEQVFGAGDTDTNAAISGALIGAYLGFNQLMSFDITFANWKILIDAANNVKGDLRGYVPFNFEALINEFTAVVYGYEIQGVKYYIKSVVKEPGPRGRKKETARRPATGRLPRKRI